MTTAVLPQDWVEQMEALTKEVRQSASGLRAQEARYLVDSYYEIQEQRKRTHNQVRALHEAGESPVLAEWLAKQSATLEGNIKKLLQAYAEGALVGQWSLSQRGIGPVIAAGLLAHIDISRAPTAGHIWRFAGLDPTVTWEKGKTRPFNARLKVLCWKIGDSFVKQSGNEACVYGKVYRERKAQEVARNEAGDFADQAAQALASKRFSENDTKKRYQEGKLPDGRLDLRARRYAVKLFLSHWHHVAYEVASGEKPPKPYVLTQEEHVHFTEPPGWPLAA